MAFILTLLVKLSAQPPDPKKPEDGNPKFPQGPQGGGPTPPAPLDPDTLIFLGMGIGLGVLYTSKKISDKKKKESVLLKFR